MINYHMLGFQNTYIFVDFSSANNPEQVFGSIERAGTWFDFYDTEFTTLEKNKKLFVMETWQKNIDLDT